MKPSDVKGDAMKRVKFFLGCSWAAIALFVVPITFLGMNNFGRTLASITGLKPSPWYTGGEVFRTIGHGTYSTIIHSPVFNEVLGQKKEELLLVKWWPLASLPALIYEQIDYNGDGRTDFVISLDTKEGKATLLRNLNPSLLQVQKPILLSDSWAIPVILKHEP